MKLRILVVLLLLGILTACATTIVASDTPCPLFPELLTIDEEMEAETPQFVIATVVTNYSLLIEYAEKLALRAGCNESS